MPSRFRLRRQPLTRAPLDEPADVLAGASTEEMANADAHAGQVVADPGMSSSAAALDDETTDAANGFHAASEGASRTGEQRVIFRGYCLMPAVPALLSDGQVVPLPGKALELLLALLEAQGRAVAAETLAQRLWPEMQAAWSSLRAQASRLRKALDRDRDLIMTVPGFGYRFAGAARWETTVQETLPDEMPSAAMSASIAHRPLQSLPPAPALIGREAEISELLAVLGERRLVTISGASGVGKTAMALHLLGRIGARFVDGACFISFANWTPPRGVAIHLAASLGLTNASRRPALARLSTFLQDKRFLLVLDACEHIDQAIASTLEALLAVAPALCVIAVSGEPLRAKDEHVVRLAPLRVPEIQPRAASASTPLASVPAVRFLIERLARLRGAVAPETLWRDAPLVAAVRALAIALDGNPLAMEWAVSQIAKSTQARLVNAVMDYLHATQERQRAWTGARHAKLPAEQVLYLSYSFLVAGLTEVQRRMLWRLSAFNAPFTHETAMQVIVDDGRAPARVGLDLEGLRTTMLTEIVEPGSARCYALRSTALRFTRSYQWDSGESAAAAQGHAQYLVNQLSSAALAPQPWLTTLPIAARAVPGMLIELRAALNWSIDAQPETACLLLEKSLPLWRHSGLLDEYLEWIDDAAQSNPALREGFVQRAMRLSAVRACALSAVGADFIAAGQAWERVEALAVRLGDVEHQARAWLGMALGELARGHRRAGLALAVRASESSCSEPTHINARHIATLASPGATFAALNFERWTDESVLAADRQGREFGLPVAVLLLLVRAVRLRFTERRIEAREWLDAARAEATEDGSSMAECMVLAVYCANAIFDDDALRLNALLTSLAQAAEALGLRHWQRMHRDFSAWTLIRRGHRARLPRLLRAVGYRLRTIGTVLPDVTLALSLAPYAQDPVRERLRRDVAECLLHKARDGEPVLLRLLERLLLELGGEPESHTLPRERAHQTMWPSSQSLPAVSIGSLRRTLENR